MVPSSIKSISRNSSIRNPAMIRTIRQHSILPGFGLTMGFTIFYLSLIVLLPLGAAFLKTFAMGWTEFWETVTGARALASYRLSIGASLIAASINSVLGLLAAWVLVRYEFPGKRIVDALIDLPFALPTAVAGITLTAMFAGNGWVGSFLEPLGISVAEARHDQENGVRPPQSGFVDLIRLEHEILAQGRKRNSGPRFAEEFRSTLEGRCVGQHGKTCGPAFGIGLRERRRMEVVADQAFRWACFFDLRNERERHHFIRWKR